MRLETRSYAPDELPPIIRYQILSFLRVWDTEGWMMTSWSRTLRLFQAHSRTTGSLITLTEFQRCLSIPIIAGWGTASRSFSVRLRRSRSKQMLTLGCCGARQNCGRFIYAAAGHTSKGLSRCWAAHASKRKFTTRKSCLCACFRHTDVNSRRISRQFRSISAGRPGRQTEASEPSISLRKVSNSGTVSKRR